MQHKTILVATDFTDIADHAVERAMSLAEPLGAHVYMLHVCEPVMPGMGPGGLGVDVRSVDQAERTAHHRLEAQAHRTPRVMATPVVEIGQPADEIVRSATRLKADLIVTGTHGRRGLSHALLGSVAESVLRHAPCPVLIVHAREP